MANMAYCRFENTFHDLVDASQYLWEEGLSKSEEKYRDKLIRLCKKIANDTSDDDLNYEEY